MPEREPDVPDPDLVSQGREKIDWVKQHMGVLRRIDRRFQEDRPFAGVRIGVCLHLEAKTAYLAQVLHRGGAEVAISSSNPLSVQDDVVAALAETGVEVHARYGATPEEYEAHLNAVLDTKPQIIIDDGADLVRLLHGPRSELADGVVSGAEETTTGITRLRALVNERRLSFPMFAVNDAMMKHLFDNRYGTGQSTWDGIMRATNLSIAGKTAVVVGYGWCGKGVAMRAAGLGADVIVTEVDPVRAIEALMDGFRVMKLVDAAPVGDLFVTVTGSVSVITREALERMKDGAILANAGHFDVEISKPDLEALAVGRRRVREHVEAFQLKDGRRLYLLAGGRLVNLVAGDGHPTEVMDLSFALQALVAEYVLKKAASLKPDLYPVPIEIDEQVARLKLETMEVEIDRLTETQQSYLESWGGT
ncbi:MAG: adenosylhomocysteinase [Candidatus Bipolaricaulia bacterium]